MLSVDQEQTRGEGGPMAEIKSNEMGQSDYLDFLTTKLNHQCKS